MTSDAQLSANRQNARSSTGPRTEEGRARSALNAQRHGLTGTQHLLPGECAEEFAHLRESVLDDAAPVGAVEEQLVDLLVDDLWRLARLRRVEAGLFAANMFELQKVDIYEELKGTGPRPTEVAPTVPPEDRWRTGKFVEAYALTERLREPTPLLGRAWDRDVAGSRAFERYSRYEGTLRARMDRTLADLERRQQARLGPNRDDEG